MAAPVATGGSTSTPSSGGGGKSSNIGAILGAAGLGSALAGLFGSSGPSMPYSGDIQNTAQEVGAQGQGLANAGAGYTQAGQQFTPQYLQAVQSYQQALQQNPNTSPADAGAVAKAIGGTNQAYDQQLAQQESALSAAGVVGPGGGGPNSTLSGLVAANGNAKAATVGNAMNDRANTAIEQRLRNLGLGSALGAQTQGQLVGEGVQGTTAGAGIENMSAEELMQLQQQIVQAQQAAAQQNAALGSGLGSLVGVAATGGF